MVDAISGREATPFWVDTLCFPLQAPDTLHHTGTDYIRSVFEAASYTLVICDSIMQSYAHSATERLTTIADSTWLTRVWTLQEGAVAKRLYFQFGFGPLDYDERLDQNGARDHTDQWLQPLNRMSEDINSYSLRKLKQSQEWQSESAYNEAKVSLRKLLRAGYVYTWRFVSFASQREHSIATQDLQPILSELYSRNASSSDMFDRLDRLIKFMQSESPLTIQRYSLPKF